jgi:hypothetical protein
MKATILLSYDENTRQVEEEEKARFLRGVLEQCFENAETVSHQLQEIWGDSETTLTAPQRVRLRSLLSIYGIQIIDNLDGHLKILLEDELIAEWYKCSYKLRKEPKVSDPRKRVFLEMEVNCWSSFEPTEETNSE